jgi:hypothetical protein
MRVMVEWTSSRDPIYFHTCLDMMQVDSLSSMMQRWTVMFLILTGIWKETRDGRCGYDLSKSKVIRWVSVGSTSPNCERKSIIWEGHVWRTSSTYMEVGDFARSSTRL